MTWRETYEKWLNSPALSEEEWKELDAIRDNDKEIEDRFYAPLVFGTAGLRGGLVKGFGRYLGRAQLVDGGQQLQLQLRRAPGARVDAETGVDAVQRESHAQQPRAAAQRAAAAGTQLGLHAAGDAREAEHLGVERRGGTGHA